jgi:hypothetical protein
MLNSFGAGGGGGVGVGGGRNEYDASTFSIDSYLYTHDDLLAVFSVGNLADATAALPQLSSLSSQASSKNALTVGASSASLAHILG